MVDFYKIFLVCDIYAKKGGGNTIIEIETGFTPPDHAMDTVDYYAARIMSKIARYSQHCSKFSLATPVIGILPISKIFLLPRNARKKEDITKVKDLCDRYYKNPPIEYDDIQNAHLHSIYLINIDKGFAKKNGIHGIGMYGELNEPELPQYRAAISIIKTLEKLTYRKLGDTSELEAMAQEIERKFKN